MAWTRKTPLERAMKRAARRGDLDPFYAALLEADLVVPRVDLLTDREGRRLRGLFTSVAALQEWEEGSPYEAVPAREALARLVGSTIPVVLNPGSELWYEFSPEEVESLAAPAPDAPGFEAQVMPAGHRLSLALPEPNPVALKQALLGALEALPVQAAYLLTAADRSGTRLLLGLVLEEADDARMAAVMAALEPLLAEHLGREGMLDAAMLNDTPLLDACAQVAPPFYRRNMPSR